MKTYRVHLEHPVSKSFRAQRAANALDINTDEKSVHDLSVSADLDAPFNVGLILGASGSGKTTLAESIWGKAAMAEVLDLGTPVIEQFPSAWDYDRCAASLIGIGLSSVPCWIRPAFTLSNGQRVRAEAALRMAAITNEGPPAVIDEWTSVVDRTVAKVMSHAIQKYIRRIKARVVLVSCHYDVVDWLNPDWIIDCNTATFHDRRLLWREFQRKETLSFSVYEVERTTWPPFAKYHYLSAKLPGGTTFCYGLFEGDDQVGFTAYTNYVPPVKGRPLIVHGHRTVIHPDYVGLGLGMKLVVASSADLISKHDVEILGRFSSLAMHRAMRRDPNHVFVGIDRPVGRNEKLYEDRVLQRGRDSVRRNVTLYLYRYIGGTDPVM